MSRRPALSAFTAVAVPEQPSKRKRKRVRSEKATVIAPQPGPQEQALSSSADIVIYGGSAGGGKTYALLLAMLRWVLNPFFTCLIFRRNLTQVRNPGGLWDTASTIYPNLGAVPNRATFAWKFPSGCSICFGHLEHEDAKLLYQGSQMSVIAFDEGTHFSESQFWYLLSRARNPAAGIPSQVWVTCNPDPDSWVRALIDWWIGPDGYPIPERSGVVRYFVRRRGILYWADNPDELLARFPKARPKSLTFVRATLDDNKILQERNPDYQASLEALPEVEMMRLLRGNWNIRVSAGKIYRREKFVVLDALPVGPYREVRFWDLAATEKQQTSEEPCYTASCKMRLYTGGEYRGLVMIVHASEDHWSVADTNTHIRNIANQDGRNCAVRWEQEGGSSGKRDAHFWVKQLIGFDAFPIRPQGDKVRRSLPLAAQVAVGNCAILRGDWNETFLARMESFPDSNIKDIPDAASGAFNALTAPRHQPGQGQAQSASFSTM